MFMLRCASLIQWESPERVTPSSVSHNYRACVSLHVPTAYSPVHTEVLVGGPHVKTFTNVIKLFGLRVVVAVLTDAVVTRPSGEVTESSANAGRIRLEQGRRGVIR